MQEVLMDSLSCFRERGARVYREISSMLQKTIEDTSCSQDEDGEKTVAEWYDLALQGGMLIIFVSDVSLDTVVAWKHYHNEHMWYFGLTVAFIVVTSLVMMMSSLGRYSEEKNPDKSGVEMWIIRLLHLLQLGPLLGFVEVLRFGYLSMMKKEIDRDKAREYYVKMLKVKADTGDLALLEAFMEAAPQLLVQIYILAQPGQDQKILQIISCVTSLISLSWAPVTYKRNCRMSDENKENLNMRSTFSMFLWFLFVTYSRMMTLGLFASVFPIVLAGILLARYIIVTVWIKTTSFPSFMEGGFLAAVYLFIFVNKELKNSGPYHAAYYLSVFVENTALISVWYAYTELPTWFKLTAISSVFASFFGGILFMISNYLCWHPSRDWFLKRGGNTVDELQDTPVKVNLLNGVELSPANNENTEPSEKT